MKKRIIPLLCIAALTICITAGCGNSHEQELEQQVKQLEQQIADLQQGTGAAGSAATDNTTANDGTTADTNTTDTAANTDLDTLTQKVAEAVAAADAAQPTGTADTDRKLFFEQKLALDTLDREVDVYEDNLEAQYRNGTLSYSDFRTQDREVEKLADRLDEAEDRLENRFGIDD